MSTLVTSSLNYLHTHFGHTLHSDRLSIALAELCLSVLRSNLPTPKTLYAQALTRTWLPPPSPDLLTGRGSPHAGGDLHPMDPPSTPSRRGRLTRSRSAPHGDISTTTPRKPPPSTYGHGHVHGHNSHTHTHDTIIIAISFLGDLFLHNPPLRPVLLQETLTFLSSAYSLPKAFPRCLCVPIALRGRRRTSTTSLKHTPLVTAGAALVVTLIQSVSGCQTDGVFGLSGPELGENEGSVDEGKLRDNAAALQRACLGEAGGVAAALIGGLLQVCSLPSVYWRLCVYSLCVY